MRATLRWAHADLRTHRGEALFIVLATAGIVASLLLAAALFGYATNPWQRVFTQSRGAHVWIHTGASIDAGRLARLGGVESVSGPYRTAATSVESHGARASVELRGATGGPPATGRPLLTSGRWLDPAAPDGVVLEHGLARALWAEPGDTLKLPGTARTLTVLGVADSAEPGYSPGERSGLVWAPPSVVQQAEGRPGQVIGLRLADPDDTDYAVQRAVTTLGAGAVTQVSPWQQARAEAQGGNRLLGQVLGLFGLGALVAAALAVYGAIDTRIRGHLRDISVLKAIGFTPGQVVRSFLVQHLAYALLGAAVATALIQTLGSRVPGRLGDAVGVWQGLVGHTAGLFGVPAAAVLFIGAMTGLAAWRAGRVPSVPVLRAAAAPGRLSGVARGALGLRLPPALVLGWHKAFTRRPRSLSAVARLALPLLLIVVALSAWTTIDRFHDEPQELGIAAALTARADENLADSRARDLLAKNRQVTAVHPGIEVAALVPGQTGTIALRGLGTHQNPYPFTLAEGRPARGPDEAVAGQGLLDALDVRVGDWVRMTVGGRPQILHIVGRNIEPENGGRVISTSLDTLRENDPKLQPTLYQLQLRPGADLAAVGAELTRTSRGQLDVHAVTNPADGLSPLRSVVIGLIAVLALIGLIELLTAIGGTVREGERDLLALKAIGLSPRQITAVAVTATGCTALAAALTGTALGLPLAHWLIDSQGRSNGIGAGIARAPSPALLMLFGAAAVLGAAALAALPASRAARRRLADTLSAVA
ncbi:ABC transporter permease [Streptomyces sp. NPDC086554]|uniref:ABC transporter permease n=1 Tax=Streptomyces sp. NPDC086554 TaxID=3154864 RepID=UPI00343EC70B